MQYWGNQTKSRSCKYPEHKGERKAARTDRAFTLKVSREVMEMFGVLVPVGAREYLPLKFSVTVFERIETRVNSSLMYCIEYIYVICRPGGPYWETLCPRSWVRPEAAVLKTEGTVFPDTDRPRPANNVFTIFFRRVFCKQFLC